MSTQNVTSEQFESVALKDGITIVDFWAEWCGPCKMFGPIFEAASEKYPEITFAKVDTDAEQAISAAAGISSIPTLMVFRDGILVYREAGALPAKSFEDLIQSVQKLDMDDIRKQIEKEENQK